MRKLTILMLLLATGCAGVRDPAPAPASIPQPPDTAPVAPAEAGPEPVPDAPPPPSDPLERAAFDVRGCLARQDFIGAEEAAGRAIGLAGNRPGPWTLGAMVAYAARDLTLAGERLRRALALSPDFADALVLRGIVRLGLGRYRAARDDFRKVAAMPVEDDRIVDLALARRHYRDLVARRRIDVSFEEAVTRGLIPVDAEVMYARAYGALADRLVSAGGEGRLQTYDLRRYRMLTDLPEPMANYLGFHLELAYGAYRDLLGDPPNIAVAGKFRARVFASPNDYRRFLREILDDTGVPEFAAGSYHPLTRELVLAGSGASGHTIVVLLHEGLHQYLDEFLREFPPWFAEGLADYFGGSTVAGNRLVPGGPNQERVEDLDRAIAAPDRIDLNSLLSLDQHSFMAGATRDFRRRKLQVRRNYALAWGFVHFLLESDDGGRRDLLLKFFRLLREGSTPAAALRGSFGPDGVDRWRAEFVDHARELVRRGRHAGAE